jgi:hypothetical protein
MITVSKERIVRDYPIDITMAGDKGTSVTHRVFADFKLLPRSERQKLAGIEAILREALVGLKPIMIEGEGEAPFSPEIRDQILDDDAMLRPLAEAYAEALAGGARRKN